MAKTTAKTKTIAKDAETGKIVSKKFAKEHPKTTFSQKVVVPAAPKKFEPQLNTDHLFTVGKVEFVGSIESFDPFVVVKHFIQNGVVADERIEGTVITDYEIEPLSRAEYFKRLGGD